jgi:hypothetical protein
LILSFQLLKFGEKGFESLGLMTDTEFIEDFAGGQAHCNLMELAADIDTDTDVMRRTVKHKRLLSIDKPQASSLGHVYFQSHSIGTIPVDPPDDANDGGGISG